MYGVERVDWSVAWDGRYIAAGVRARGIRCLTSPGLRFPRGTLVHWGCMSRCLQGAASGAARGHRMLATLFHGDFGVHAAMDRQLEAFLEGVPRLERVVVANAIMQARLQRWGVPASKVERIPIGVDHALFRPANPGERERLRRQYGIPADRVCIGSFQKDGKGWGAGLQPKHIKGPDRFVAVARELSRHVPVHCLLTGPSRGYVMQGLAQAGIPCTHLHVANYRDMARVYRCLDLYLVTSREEGGPKAVLEGAASGIPVVSTRVGMAEEVLRDATLLADDEDALVEAALRVLEGSVGNRDETAATYRSWSFPFGWPEVAARHAALYRELLHT